MKVKASIKGRGTKVGRRWREGYYAKRKGIIRFYAYDDSNKGPRINVRGNISKKRLKLRKY